MNEWKRFIDNASDNNDRGKEAGYASLMPRLDFLIAYLDALTNLRERFDEGMDKQEMITYVGQAIEIEKQNLLKRERAW